MKDYTRGTQLLYTGDAAPGNVDFAETMPVYQTTAFTVQTPDEASERYKLQSQGDAYMYVRSSNPNRAALAEAMSFLEGGEMSIVTSSGMGAIMPTLLSFLNAGDRFIYSNVCYGETLEAASEIFVRFGVDAVPVNIDDLGEVKAALTPNTSVILTEVAANPQLRIADIDELAKLAHSVGALLIVDNTFTTPYAIRPLEHGADLVVNSITKFLNGHSDACIGAVTGRKELVSHIDTISQICGTPSDPYSSWLALRGLKTADLRIPRQMKNAALLAAALEKDPHVEKVMHPSLESFPGHETAMKLFGDGEKMTPMLSIVITEDLEKRNKFAAALKFVHYAPTLGGVRTTYQQPVISSHSAMPDEERRALGITPGMFRISVGIEDPDDLIKEFTEALKAMD